MALLRRVRHHDDPQRLTVTNPLLREVRSEAPGPQADVPRGSDRDAPPAGGADRGPAHDRAGGSLLPPSVTPRVIDRMARQRGLASRTRPGSPSSPCASGTYSSKPPARCRTARSPWLGHRGATELLATGCGRLPTRPVGQRVPDGSGAVSSLDSRKDPTTPVISLRGGQRTLPIHPGFEEPPEGHTCYAVPSVEGALLGPRRPTA